MSHLSTINTNIQYSIRLTQNESLPSQFLDKVQYTQPSQPITWLIVCDIIKQTLQPL